MALPKLHYPVVLKAGVRTKTAPPAPDVPDVLAGLFCSVHGFSIVQAYSTNQVQRYFNRARNLRAMDTHLQTRQILARNVRILMEMRDWNQHDLQRKAHVSQKTVSNVVNGRQSTQIDVIEKLAAAFRVEPFHLLLPNIFPQDLYPIPPAAA